MSTALRDRLVDAIERAPRFPAVGRVARVAGTAIEIEGLPASIGAIVEIERPNGAIAAEVVGFRDERIICAPYGEAAGIAPGAEVRVRSAALRVPVGPGLIGRVINAFGRPIDGKGPISAPTRAPHAGAVRAMERSRIDRPVWTGVRTIDAFTTPGRGGRIGIFAGSGVGKSTIIAMIARHAEADVNVIAIVGERGREVAEFIDDQIGVDGLARSVVVVATGDEPALLRMRAAETATAIAEGFRDEGKDVLFLMDSVTRYATAAREVGLAAGEPPVMRGFPPSVFSLLPKLLERTGNGARGSITAFYAVLVEGGDFDEPVSDAVRSIVDGHVILSRRIAERNHWPAIDVPASLSRVMPAVTDATHREAAGSVRSMIAAYEEARDLIEVGAYARGSNPLVDLAIDRRLEIEAFTAQRLDDRAEPAVTVAAIAEIARPAASVSTSNDAEMASLV